MSQTLQPLLHDLLVCLQAPVQCWARYDGQVTGVGAEGVYVADTRVLDTAVLTVSGQRPEHLSASQDDHGALRTTAVVRHVDGPGADPTFRLVRTRHVDAQGMDERIVLTSANPAPVTVDVRLDLHSDLARMDSVKQGARGTSVSATLDRGGLTWADGRVDVRVESPTAQILPDDAHRPALLWRSVTVPPREPVELTWRVTCHDSGAVVAAAPARPDWQTPEVQADDRRLGRLVARAMSDLRSLRMVTSDSPQDVFLAAGAPWFFTLFGRDSLWAARMLLPLGTDLAAGTLRTLARRQGSRTDPVTAEEPGKILHELRATDLSHGGSLRLPPLYYGTIDATPLWVCLLGDAWRWGMPDSVVEPLLPTLERCLTWMSDHGDSDGDGFLEYVDRTSTGLANQGWKDSGDSVQWRDGHLARGPIALAEVQGYAYEAATTGADLLEAFGRPGADRWRSWAADLAGRFREQFWVSTAEGDHPAIALDADKRPVDSLTSNIGHLLGTGILDAEESRRIADLVVGPGLDSGYGLRTMSTGASGYWPLSYHGGTVWPHDTAIVIAGLTRAGLTDAALTLSEGLLAAAPHFGYRLPELFGGDPAPTAEAGAPVPYPAACRPQAWSAASAIAVLNAFLGLVPDVPAGRLDVRPAASPPVGALTVRGLRVAGEPLDVSVDRDGKVQTLSGPGRLAVRVG